MSVYIALMAVAIGIILYAAWPIRLRERPRRRSTVYPRDLTDRSFKIR